VCKHLRQIEIHIEQNIHVIMDILKMKENVYLWIYLIDESVMMQRLVQLQYGDDD
jgi:hypothetical protein